MTERNGLQGRMLIAAKQLRTEAREQARKLRDEEVTMINMASHEHVALRDHYWEKRHKAEERARAAARLVEALR